MPSKTMTEAYMPSIMMPTLTRVTRLLKVLLLRPKDASPFSAGPSGTARKYIFLKLMELLEAEGLEP